MKKFLLSTFVLTLSLNISAQDYERNGIDDSKGVPKGLKVGDKAPKIEGKTMDGKNFDSSKILNEKEIILVFYRGEWCPYCTKHLSNINDSLSIIKSKNALVVAVGPESEAYVETTKEKSGAQFIVISDEDEKVMKEYDVLFNVNETYQNKIRTKMDKDIAEQNNKDEARLPIPATYIIGKDGKIKFVHFDLDYRKRSNVKTILEQL